VVGVAEDRVLRLLLRPEEDRVLRLLRRPVGSPLRQLRLRRRPARASAI